MKKSLIALTAASALAVGTMAVPQKAEAYAWWVIPAGYIAAVADATLSVSRGEIFVIMGLSGSGKSTLVRCLARLIEPSTGEVMFAGRNLLDASPAELIELRRHKMGMVFQHFALLPHLTVLGNVAFPLEIQGVGRQERDARAREMTELVGLKGREHNLPQELSGGQQQRVGIARSLATNPDIWFLDEPFSALDPLIRREMQNEFLRLQSVLHKTIVFITHDFDEAIRLADRIAIMQDGRIVQIGTPEELLLSPADDYVAEFTRDAPRAKILSARAIARPRRNGEDIAGSVKADSKVAEFAKEVEASNGAFGVHDADGKLLGVVDRAAVVSVLIGATEASLPRLWRWAVGRPTAGFLSRSASGLSLPRCLSLPSPCRPARSRAGCSKSRRSGGSDWTRQSRAS
jgi:glycine betaine/proline transport system ATP-binding protein